MNYFLMKGCEDVMFLLGFYRILLNVLIKNQREGRKLAEEDNDIIFFFSNLAPFSVIDEN